MALLQPHESTQQITLVVEPATTELVTIGLIQTFVRLLVTTLARKDTPRRSVWSARKTTCEKTNNSLGDLHVNE